jgi:hypothetical protein
MRALRAVVVVVAGLALGFAVYHVATVALAPHRTTPVYDPPVLAGQHLWGYCSGGVYARLGDEIVLTSAGHCTGAGTVANAPDGTRLGVFGPPARDATCPAPGHTCAASDIDFLVVAPDRIPWGHLNEIDMGVGGYRTVEPGSQALSCADIAIGDQVEIDGRNLFRTGHVVEKGENNKPADQDGSYFPCMVAADVQVTTGDSGGVVLVRGLPAGVTSRSFGGYLGFTPLAEGLDELGLVMCDTPNCGLTPPSR